MVGADRALSTPRPSSKYTKHLLNTQTVYSEIHTSLQLLSSISSLIHFFKDIFIFVIYFSFYPEF